MDKEKVEDEIKFGEKELQTLANEAEQKVVSKGKKVENEVETADESTKRKWIKYFLCAISIIVVLVILYHFV